MKFTISAIVFTTVAQFLFFLHCSDNKKSSYKFRLCSDIAATVTSDTSLAATAAGTKLVYQLQNAVPAELAASGFDLAVMDYSSDGSEGGRYGAAAISSIQSGGTKQVLAYLSIGEAEEYRYYFDSGWINGGQPDRTAPCWLCRADVDWAGNYKVQYWSEEWQAVVMGYLDKIIDDGYDGVYLDIIDGFEYWSDPHNGEGYSLSAEEAALRMISFVKRIAHHARVTKGKPNFLIFPQNGEGILDYDTGISGLTAGDYLNTINGIGVEDLYYNETDPVATGTTNYRKTFLDVIKGASKKVFVIDYVDTGSHGPLCAGFRTKASADGYYPYAARSDRDLDEINSFTGQP